MHYIFSYVPSYNTCEMTKIKSQYIPKAMHFTESTKIQCIKSVSHYNVQSMSNATHFITTFVVCIMLFSLNVIKKFRTMPQICKNNEQKNDIAFFKIYFIIERLCNFWLVSWKK